MTYGALNTVTTADADHAWEAITPSNQLRIHGPEDFKMFKSEIKTWPMVGGIFTESHSHLNRLILVMDDVFVSSLSRHWLVKAAEQPEKLLVIMVHSNADRKKFAIRNMLEQGYMVGLQWMIMVRKNGWNQNIICMSVWNFCKVTLE